MHINAVFPPSKKRKGGGRYNFSMRSKQIKHFNDHIKGNQVKKGGGGGGGAPWTPLWGNTVNGSLKVSIIHFNKAITGGVTLIKFIEAGSLLIFVPHPYDGKKA